MNLQVRLQVIQVYETLSTDPTSVGLLLGVLCCADGGAATTWIRVWIYHYTLVQQFQPDGTPIIDHVFEPFVSVGHLPPKYLRCLVWFGLGAENSRNALSRSVGEFLVIRSEEEPSLVAMVQLDWDCLAKLAEGMNA